MVCFASCLQLSCAIDAANLPMCDNSSDVRLREDSPMPNRPKDPSQLASTEKSPSEHFAPRVSDGSLEPTALDSRGPNCRRANRADR